MKKVHVDEVSKNNIEITLVKLNKGSDAFCWNSSTDGICVSLWVTKVEARKLRAALDGI